MTTQIITNESLEEILRQFEETPVEQQAAQLDRILDDMAEQELKESELSRPDRFEME